jgi:hypothetical protein
MYRTDCDTAPSSAAKPVIESKHPAAAQPSRSSFISGELKGGEGYHILMSDWRATMTPQKATLDSMRTIS